MRTRAGLLFPWLQEWRLRSHALLTRGERLHHGRRLLLGPLRLRQEVHAGHQGGLPRHRRGLQLGRRRLLLRHVRQQPVRSGSWRVPSARRPVRRGGGLLYRRLHPGRRKREAVHRRVH